MNEKVVNVWMWSNFEGGNENLPYLDFPMGKDSSDKVKVLDLNSESISAVDEVIYAMFLSTSKDGKLYAAPLNFEGYARTFGYQYFEMDIDTWKEEYDAFLMGVQDLLEEIKSEEIDEEELGTHLEENCYSASVIRFASRIRKLTELDAPDFVIAREEKAFAYNLVLNQYCTNTL